MSSGWMNKPSHLATYLNQLRDEADVIQRCIWCDWTWAGAAAEGRSLAEQHRRKFHRKAGRKKGRRKR